jgi:hypothetical protein
MKPESDFSFSEPPVETTHSAEPSMQLPFALLTCAIAVLMIAQTVSTFKQRSALQEGQHQLADAFKQREKVVKQSVDIQSKLNDMIMDLLILSKTDDDAKQIVGKYNIQQQQPAAVAPAEAPAK